MDNKKPLIIYGANETPVQKRSLEVLSKLILEYTNEYTGCYRYGTLGGVDISNCRLIYIGTKENNPYIKENSAKTLTKPEEYYILVKNDEVIIQGYDDAGVLYGCVDFYNKYLIEYDFISYGKFIDAIPEFKLQSAPSIKNRGLWTWGHVIYDYRSYIDNMVKLKMNTLIMWNEFAPLNASEILEYAHSNNVKLIWGFSWLYNFNKEVDIEHVDDKIDGILEEFERNYSKIALDGIYFQTFTESLVETHNGIDIAESATNFVNKVSARFFEKYPNLEIQFGLHATSVKNKLDIMKRVDERVQIVWEDCGAFPFTYSPMATENFDETVDFMTKVANLRGKSDNFGVVTKGITCLDWKKFEHHTGPYTIGVSNRTFRAERAMKKRRVWRWVQSFWTTNAVYVQKMLKTLCDAKNGNLYVTGLVEDGMFEEKVFMPVAMFGELMWNPNLDLTKEYNLITLRHYVEFV